MPTLSAKAFQELLGGGLPRGAIVALHGANETLKSDLLKSIYRSMDVDPHDPFRVVRLENTDLDSDSARLADELTAISMFGGSRLVLAHCAARRMAERAELALSLPRGECVLALSSGALSEGQDLRSLAGAHRDILEIECAEEAAGDFRAFVVAELARRDVTLDAAALDTFLQLVGEDRPAARAEIEKACCYLGAPGSLTSDEIVAVVADGAGFVAGEIAKAAVAGRLTDIARGLDEMDASGADPQQALMAASWQCANLYRGKLKRWAFADRGTARNLSEAELRQIMGSLNEAVLRARRDSTVGAVASRHALLALARTVDAKARKSRR